ncbi:hypothetical protein AGMMS50229_05040 [Campylobacterota bacterium]|nr:hypothetical protein AGMMS50229_05040 [Campylobacterota bacterium]
MKKYLLFLTLLASVWAENFVLQNDNILLEKAVEKINEMTTELKTKTGVSVYVSAINKLENNETIALYAKRIGERLEAPFALIALSSTDVKIDLITSPDLAEIVDRDEVLDDYIIPLFVEVRRDLTTQQQLSAGVFNGVAFLTDTIAEDRGIVLESSVGSGSKNFYEGLMWVIKIMIVLTLVGIFIAYRRSKAGA